MLKGIFFGFLLSGSLLTSSIAAQSIVGSGYTAPAPVSVAPGQIATFYVSGWYLGIAPTPTTTAASTPSFGITAIVEQNGAATPAPVQSVQPVSLCAGTIAVVAACGSLLAVTVQIPYELVPTCLLCALPPTSLSYVPPELTLIDQNGQAATPIELNPVADQVHVLTGCDIAVGGGGGLRQPGITGLPCTPLVTHGDGTLVSASNPANVGEALTAWVFGLGQTNPSATTGQPQKTAPSAETFKLDFNYQVNALPAKPFTGEPDRVPLTPLFAGLSPGYVGLYQVNFVVPEQPPNGTPRCALTFAAGGNTVQSNLTVSIGGQYSFDGAGICVATQIPVD